MSKKSEKFVEDKLQVVTDGIIKALEEGTAPWIIPWEAGKSPQVPHNPVTGNTYSGINNLWLSMQGRSDPRWTTFNGGQKSGWGSVIKGEKASYVEKWLFDIKKDKKDDKGKVVIGDDGKPEKVTHKLSMPIRQVHAVFNAEQFENAPPYEHDNSQSKEEWERHENAEKILTNSGAKIEHINGSRACYMPTSDKIILPERGQFKTADNYYATALHELGHQTGHHTRLDRDLSHPFGTPGYAKEELRAEISSYMMNTDLQLGHDPSQHVSYIKSWIKNLKDDPNEIRKACRDADKIVQYNMQFLEKTNEQIVENSADQHNQNEVTMKTLTETPKDDRYLQLGFLNKNPNDEKAFYAMVAESNGVVEINLGNKTLDFTEIQNKQLTIVVSDTSQDSQFYSFNNVKVIETKGLDEKSINIQVNNALSESNHDGIVLTENKEPVHLINIDGLQHKSINQMVHSERMDKSFLNVPFEEKDEAYKLGAAWSGDAKSWFVPKGSSNESSFSKWKGDRVVDSPEKQFAVFIEEQGGDLKGQMPIMDGKIQRIHSSLGKSGNRDFSYAGYSDDIPAGWVKDWHSEKVNWTSKQHKALSEHEKKQLEKQAQEKRVARSAERDKTYEATAKESKKYTDGLKPLTDTKYHSFKEINYNSNSNIKQDEKGNLVLPLCDVNGKQWSHTTLQANGFKQLFKDAKLQGNFFVVGADKIDKNTDAIMIAEGYSTAAAIENSIERPVIVATHADNLSSVANALREKHPEARIYFFADNDENLKSQGLENKGLVKANKAAEEVGGHVVLPHFDEKEPHKDRTDFHDMLKLSGKEGVKNHINAQVKMIRAKETLNKENTLQKEQIEKSQKYSQAVER